MMVGMNFTEDVKPLPSDFARSSSSFRIVSACFSRRATSKWCTSDAEGPSFASIKADSLAALLPLSDLDFFFFAITVSWKELSDKFASVCY